MIKLMFGNYDISLFCSQKSRGKYFSNSTRQSYLRICSTLQALNCRSFDSNQPRYSKSIRFMESNIDHSEAYL